MKYRKFNLILLLVGGLFSNAGFADDKRIQQELADPTEIVPPLQQVLGKEALDKVIASGKYTYTGNTKCRLCHRDFFLGRKEDAHDHANEKLLASGAENAKNPRCLYCHTTGYGVKSGFKSMQTTPRLANVQCEGCHGPGSEHVKRQIVKMPGAKKDPNVVLGGFLAGTDSPKLLRKMCQSCHTARWNHSFTDLDKAYDGYKKAKPTASP